MEQNWLAFVYRGIVSFSQCTAPCIPPGTAQHKQKVHKQHCFIAITHVRRSPPLFSSTIQTFTPFHKTWWLTTMWPCRQGGSTQTEMRSKILRSLAHSWSTRAIFSSSAPSEFGTEEAFWREGTSFKENSTRFQLHKEIQDWKIKNLFPTIFETQNGVWRESAWKCSVIQVTNV